jgi:hypothetical protein
MLDSLLVPLNYLVMKLHSVYLITGDNDIVQKIFIKAKAVKAHFSEGDITRNSMYQILNDSIIGTVLNADGIQITFEPGIYMSEIAIEEQPV